MFTITQGKGFHITFENGITISTQFGKGNTCERRYMEDVPFMHQSNDAAICIWKDGLEGYLTRHAVADVLKVQGIKHITVDFDDDEIGYCSVTDWAKLVAWCKSQS